ncbi:MAG: hypothetical protein KDJ90_02620 [Nitratireductor sp.]|nr:hypothetical protein [Nitratireductor sp.]
MAFSLVILGAGPSLAHTSEQAFVLLMPTGLYVTAGCLAVMASILTVSVMPRTVIERFFRTVSVRWRPPREALWTATSLASFCVLCAAIYMGFNGPRDPLTNLLTLGIWTGWWIILFALCGLLGNLWTALNPWLGPYRLLLRPTERNGWFRLPERIGSMPAVLMALAFFGFMVADPAPSDPGRLATVIGLYWVFHFLGMILFGGEAWLRQCEAITQIFALISRTGLVQWLQELKIGLPGWQIARGSVEGTGLSLLALLILAGGSFDGLKETFWWLGNIGINPLEFPGRTAVIGSSLAGFAVFAAILTAGFLITCWSGKALLNRFFREGMQSDTASIFRAFAPAVLPIALGYHMSHFLTSFLIDGQYVLAVLGDPFARGANYFGLAEIRVTTGFLSYSKSAQAIWLTQFAFVVTGHVLSVLVSHRIALRLFGDTHKALIGQIPLAFFMVAYTWFGLWLLAVPRSA